MPAPSIIVLLIKDHHAVAQLLKEALSTTTRAEIKRVELSAKIIEALTVHTQFEEGELYPLLMTDEVDAETRDAAFEAVEEHAQIKTLLREIPTIPVADPRWKAKMTVLTENITHHVKEEEQKGGLFDRLKDATDASQLAELGRQFQARRAHQSVGQGA